MKRIDSDISPMGCEFGGARKAETVEPRRETSRGGSPWLVSATFSLFSVVALGRCSTQLLLFATGTFSARNRVGYSMSQIHQQSKFPFRCRNERRNMGENVPLKEN